MEHTQTLSFYLVPPKRLEGQLYTPLRRRWCLAGISDPLVLCSHFSGRVGQMLVVEDVLRQWSPWQPQ